MSSLCIIRGQPGRWEGIAVDSGLAIAGPSFAQVRRCLAEAALLNPGARGSIEAAFLRFEAKLRRGLYLAGHFRYLLLRRLGLSDRLYESHLIHDPA